MPINSLTISQSHIINGCNLLSISNPLAFICDAFYSGQNPEFLYVDIYKDGLLLNTYRAIPYYDLTATIRQFIFFADSVLKSYFFADYNNKPLDDFAQSSGTLTYVENLTKEFTIQFRDPYAIAESITIDIVTCFASSQFDNSDGVAMTDQFNNIIDTYYCGDGDTCYVYFYNSNVNNVLSINSVLGTAYATDSNDDIFTDSNDDKFIITT